MQQLKSLRNQRKTTGTSYSAVGIDADSRDAATDARARIPPPRGWPTSPGLVKRDTTRLVIDCLSLVLPIIFIALAVAAVKLDAQRISSYGKRVQGAILLGPTIYPLVFAALGGQALRKIARWRAVEGTTLGFLEHLLGSQSLVATVGHAVTLHSFSGLTIALLAFWALSPLGGQSVLRLLRETTSTTLETRPVYYSNVDAVSQFTGPAWLDAFNRGNAVISTAMLTADSLDRTPEDAWSHPKIPRIEEIENAALSNSTDHSWYDVDPASTYSYASLAGVNIMHVSERGFTNFTVPYEYIFYNCELSPGNNITTFGSSAPPQPYGTSPMDYLLGLMNKTRIVTGNFPLPQNSSSPPFQEDSTFFMYISSTLPEGESPPTLLYGSKYVATSWFLWECSMNSLMVEANIICQSSDCSVDRVRRARVHNVTSRRYDATPYGVVHNSYNQEHFVRAITSLGGRASLGRANPVDAYICGNRPWGIEVDGGNMQIQNWTEYVGSPQKTKDMSHRLTKVLNAYLDSSRWPMSLTQSDPFFRSTEFLNTSSGQPTASLRMSSTEATVTLLDTVYRVNASWAALLIICSVLLLLLSIFGVLIQWQTVAPDIFNHVSSLTRDNPHVNAPDGGSGLDEADRARLLRRLRVQLGDVNAKSQIGYIAFKSVNSKEDCRQGRIRKERMYR